MSTNDIAKQSDINIQVGLNSEKHPVKIEWMAQDSGLDGKKESKAMMKKEVSFMKKKGAPKSMVKHEMAEAGMKYGGKVKKMAGGGLAAGHKSADGIAKKGKTDTKRVVMKSGGAVKKMRYGGKTC